MNMANSYSFLPWVREGAVSAIEAEDVAGANLNSRVQIDVAVHLNNNAATDASVKVRLYGPGDVTGFDARQVIRTDPQHLTSDFEPNYFPTVEFDRPDFPWLLTPARASNKEQLRPWICLVAVEKQDDNLKADPTKPLPVLTADPKTELPDLTESWAWAHAQVSGDIATATELDNVLANAPERNLSRLLCPRKLEQNKSYYACVVPAFDVGRKAGLGEEVKDGAGEADETLKPAWDVNTKEKRSNYQSTITGSSAPAQQATSNRSCGFCSGSLFRLRWARAKWKLRTLIPRPGYLSRLDRYGPIPASCRSKAHSGRIEKKLIQPRTLWKNYKRLKTTKSFRKTCAIC